MDSLNFIMYFHTLHILFIVLLSGTERHGEVRILEECLATPPGNSLLQR